MGGLFPSDSSIHEAFGSYKLGQHALNLLSSSLTPQATPETGFVRRVLSRFGEHQILGGACCYYCSVRRMDR